MKLRALVLPLAVAALWAGVAVAQGGAVGAQEPGPRMQAAAVEPDGTAATRRLTARERRIRRYCRRAKRRLKAHRETRRQARKRRRLCRRRARRYPGATPTPTPRPAPVLIKPGTAAPNPAPPARYVSVQAREFFFTLSRPLVGTGVVTVELRNNGEDPHNLVVSPDGTHDSLLSFADHGPGEVSAANITLQAGRYYLWCSLEGHEAAGMHATLRVE